MRPPDEEPEVLKEIVGKDAWPHIDKEIKEQARFKCIKVSVVQSNLNEPKNLETDYAQTFFKYW